jgi:hypothetical protein
MTALSKHWSAERSRLLVMALSSVTAVALSYDYMAATGDVGIFLAIIGVGVLLAALVAVPVLLFENESASD